MGNKSALVLLLCLCLIFDQVYASKKRVLVKKRRKVVKDEESSSKDEEESASKPREKRLIGANFGLFGEEAVPITTTSYEATSVGPESSYYSTVSEVYPAGAKLAIPYAVNSEDLVALEQRQQEQQQQQQQQVVYPYDSEEYRQQFYYYADGNYELLNILILY